MLAESATDGAMGRVVSPGRFFSIIEEIVPPNPRGMIP